MIDPSKLIEALPKETINTITKTACDVFRDFTYPMTALTKGAGLLIETKFQALNDMQKVLATQAIQRTKEKVEKSNLEHSASIKPLIFYIALECADNFGDKVQEELWSNVLAREVVSSSIHPEIARLLSKLTTDDLLLLNSIAMNQEKGTISRILATFSADKSVWSPVQKSFNHFYLSDLGLIIREDGKWITTYAGVELLCSLEPIE